MTDIAWDEMGIDLTEVQSWIVETLPDLTLLPENVEILNRKDWSLVARFPAHGKTERSDVIYKATLLPEFRQGPLIFALLTGTCPEDTPYLLDWRAVKERVEMLFRPFSGTTVQEAGTLDSLLQMARTVASIQSKVAALPASATASLPHLPIQDIPTLFDSLIADISSTYRPYWDANDGELLKEFGVPPDFMERLVFYRPHIERWSTSLEQNGPPESLDHVDCLPHNAIIRPDGRTLIYDWEQAAIGCPFFSIDILMAFAQNFEETRAASTNGQGSLLLTEEKATPSATALRRAYLDAFEWGTQQEREYAMALALCLSPIRYAYSEGQLAARFGNERYHAEDLAWWLMRGLRRWKRMASRENQASPRIT